ncbi:MAG: glycosyltransferase [Clostridia bacterium]|nr:glycosyltransferase [Clostridia bacterium]
MSKQKKVREDALLHTVEDRRNLTFVPDPTKQRSNNDRRNNMQSDAHRPEYARYAGMRYEEANLFVRMKLPDGNKLRCKCANISQTGMKLNLPENFDVSTLNEGDTVHLRFKLEPGMLQEGTEKNYNLKSTIVRVQNDARWIALQFEEPLYVARRSASNLYFTLATGFLFLITLIILLMRVESVTYFSTHAVLYGYSLLACSFLLSRYFFGMLYKPIAVDPDYTPSVTIVVPCFNEETWIRRTIISCINQDYPPEKLELIIVDDGSSDRSPQVIQETINDLCVEGKRYGLDKRIRVFFQQYNQGKRDAMGVGIRNCNTELITFVDSDSFLEPDAIRNLVQPMKDPKMGGVSGRTDVANTYTNHLTKMQSVRYYISFRMMKAAEAYFDSVMCLSGPLSCYRLSAVKEVAEPWLHQQFMGQKATFGDDRSLTNFIVKNHRTYYQDTAICSTIVPNKHKVFLKQQMRWKRSWLRESITAGKFMWKKEPLMAIFFYMGLLVPMIAPLIVLYNLVYVPIVRHVFPGTFLLGILLMGLLMSFAQLILKRSSLWFYGLLFCLYYEGILLWQMPWAWLTFWVSHWGTRSGGRKKQQTAASQSA